MNKKLKYIIILLLTICFWTIQKRISAQDSCQIAIIEANTMYDNGNYQKVIDLLKERVNSCDYSRDAKLQVYKLLAASYSEIDDIENAEKYTLKFIKKEPEYELQSYDPITFSNTFKRYSCRPNWSAGLSLSSLQTNITLVKKYTILYNIPDSTVYLCKGSVPLNLFIQKHFSKRFSTTFEFLNYNFRMVKNVSYSDFYKYEYKESGFIFKFANYYTLKLATYKKISLSYLLGWYTYTYQNPEYTLKFTANNFEDEISGERIYSILDKGNFGFLTGLGFNYKIDRFSIFLYYRFGKDLISFNSFTSRYETPDLLVNYLFIDDEIRLSQNEITIGFSYNLFYKIKHKYK